MPDLPEIGFDSILGVDPIQGKANLPEVKARIGHHEPMEDQMSRECRSAHLAILAAKETIFFAPPSPEGPLRQWIELTLDNCTGALLRGQATLLAGGEEVHTPLSIRPGQHVYRCDAPVLWPHFEPAPYTPVTVTAGGHTIRGTSPVGGHRPWTIYLLSDTCVDYTWAYEDLERVSADAAAVIKAELAACRATADAPFGDQNRYNVLHTSELEFFLEHASPEEIEEWARWTRSGHLTLSPYRNMAMTAAQSLEEGIRQFYPARDLEQRWGISIGYANHQETPTITWGQATILAESGIGHLVKSILPYECPWNGRLVEPPIYFWEGPGGNRVLVRHRKTDYVEGRFVLDGLEATDTALHQQIIPYYEGLGAIYPLDAIALVGCYGDLAPKTPEYAALKSRNVAAYNARGWAYPRLVNASHAVFWQDVDAQLKTRSISLPTYRGDYGCSWDAWPLGLARIYAGWRRAQERSYAADSLAAIASSLDSTWFAANQAELAEGWYNLLCLSDHAWNGSSDGSRALNARLRQDWQDKANARFDAVIQGALQVLGRHVRAGEGRTVLVFNPLGWKRSGIARLQGPGVGPFTIRDRVSGEVMPSQMLPGAEERSTPALSFLARDLPPFGYRTYVVSTGTGPVDCPMIVSAHGLENEFYRLEVSPATGGIVSLYDKQRQHELVDGNSPYQLNQMLYLSGEEDRRLGSVEVSAGECGPLQGQLRIEGRTQGATLRTTLTLYADLERIDICNELHKEPCADKEQINYAFPFDVPGRRYRLETPGAIIVPGDIAYGGEQRPGSGQAVNLIRHFVEIYNDELGVTLVSLDTGVMQFGHRTQAEAPQQPDPDNSTVLSLALSNLLDWNEILHDQHQVRDFCFRYALYPHGGGCDAVRAVHHGMERAQDLLAVMLKSQQVGTLPPDQHSFLEVQPGNAIPTALKVAAESSGTDIVLRLWEPGVADQAVQARVDASGWGVLCAALTTDLLERECEALEASAPSLSLPLKPRGLATVKLTFERKPATCNL